MIVARAHIHTEGRESTIAKYFLGVTTTLGQAFTVETSLPPATFFPTCSTVVGIRLDVDTGTRTFRLPCGTRTDSTLTDTATWACGPTFPTVAAAGLRVHTSTRTKCLPCWTGAGPTHTSLASRASRTTFATVFAIRLGIDTGSRTIGLSSGTGAGSSLTTFPSHT